MEYLVTAEEMKRYDSNTIERIGIPGMVLMERAALEAFRFIEDRFADLEQHRKTVRILAGVGNNGGDGLALARMLCEAGYDVTVEVVGKAERSSEQWKIQKEILEHFPIRTGSKEDGVEYTILVDALFGVGLSRNVEGEYAEAVERFNRATGFKIALDVPSGIHSDTGKVLGCAIKAHMTVTFGFCKRGLMFCPGTEYAGEVVTVPIGITERSFLGKEPGMFFYKEPIKDLLPKRNSMGNKGTFGKVLLVAGSAKMAGAAVLAAKAAYRSGVGMVKVITPGENRSILLGNVPEALFGTEVDLAESMKWADVIAIGPGLGKDSEALQKLTQVIYESNLPLILDADGLNILAEQEDLQKELAKQGTEGRSIILTPHVGELSRLMKLPIMELKEDLSLYGKQLAEQLRAVVVAKDARTFTCRAGGAICVNVCGNSGMATAGSGDVLTGVVAGLLAQGMEAFEAASVGVYLHARAGDMVAGERGEYACMAGDIIEKL